MRKDPARRWFRDPTGSRRTVLTTVLRPTEAEYARIEKVAQQYGMSVEQLLARALKEGVERAVEDARRGGLDI